VPRACAMHEVVVEMNAHPWRLGQNITIAGLDLERMSLGRSSILDPRSWN
jgi:hypothetical protein